MQQHLLPSDRMDGAERRRAALWRGRRCRGRRRRPRHVLVERFGQLEFDAARATLQHVDDVVLDEPGALVHELVNDPLHDDVGAVLGESPAELCETQQVSVEADT